MRPKTMATLEHVSIVGAGDAAGRKAAKLTIDAIGIGNVIPLAGTAGNGAAGAALNISTLTAVGSRLVRLEVAGDTNIRFQAAAGVVVTATLWHAAIQAGTGRTFLLDQRITHVSGWGIGGAWSFVVFPLDEVG